MSTRPSAAPATARGSWPRNPAGQPAAARQQARIALEAELRDLVVEDLAAETQHRAASGKPAMAPLDRRRRAEATAMRHLRQRFDADAATGTAPLSPTEERQVRENVLARVFSRLPELEALLARPDVTDILFNGPGDARVRTIDDREERVRSPFASDADMVAFVRAVSRKGGDLVAGEDPFGPADGGGIEQEFSETRPFVDLRLSPSGARFAAVGPWVTLAGTYVSIRRHPLVDADLERLVDDWDMLDEQLAGFLGAAVRLGLRILISGRPGAGKTTLLRALAHELHPDVRIVQIEQNPELGLELDEERHNQVVPLVERPPNMEGKGEVTIADHVRAAQRHLPDYVIVGEVRGSEAIALLKAMSMDVPGMCTLHAESAAGVFSRLVFYAQEADSTLTAEYVLRATAEGLDLVVHLGRGTDGRRVITEVLHVGGYDEIQRRPISDEWFIPGPAGSAVPNPKAPIPVDLLEDLRACGFDDSAPAHRRAGW